MNLKNFVRVFLSLSAAALLTCAPAWAQNVSLNLNGVTVSKAISEIQSAYGWSVVVKSSEVDMDRKISVSVNDVDVKTAVKKIFEGQPVEVSVVGRTVTVAEAVPVSASAKPDDDKYFTLTGVVKTEDGEPLLGAGIVVKGRTGAGALADLDGNFSIKVARGEKLTVSFVGYSDAELTVSGRDPVEIVLVPDSEFLAETVVVGYGTQKKVNLTGAIATISSDNLDNRVSPTLTHMLQGSVPGLNVTTSSGRPGNGASINIRGVNSINGGNPLVLVDGAESDLARVNPADVESISVIKDASAAAIYGARASFGVILVTTKAGASEDGWAKVRINSRFGWEEPTTSTEFETRGYYSVYLNDLFYNAANGTNYSFYTSEDMQQLWARRNDKVEDPSRPWVVIDQRDGRDTYVYYGNTDWYHELFRDRHPNQQHNISVSGGANKVRYFLSASYNQEDGIFRRNTDRNRKYNFRSKVSYDIKKWLSLSNNTSYYKSSYKYPGPSGVNTTFSQMTVHALASYPAHNPDGSSLGFTSFANNNYVMDGLLTILDNPNYKNEDVNDNLSTTTEMVIKPLPSLEIRGSFTYSLNQYRNTNRSVQVGYSRYPGEIITMSNSRSISSLSEIVQTQHYYATNLYATWNRTFADAHNLKLMAGFNWEAKNYKDISAKAYYLLSDTLSDLNLAGSGSDGNTRMETGGGQNQYALEGYFARVNYDYMGRYLFEASGRFDGSSRFASSHRWGFFPSASAGWRISEEKFFTEAKKIVNNFKFRYSFGSLGNQQVGYYDYIRKISVGTGSYIFGTGTKPTVATIGAPVASDLTWEKTSQHDLGVDMSFLDDRLVFTADAYIRDTKDMLTAGVALPSVYGASSPKMNAADLRTKGYELSLVWRDSFRLLGRTFRYSASVSFSDYVSKITKFDNPERSFAKSYYEGMTIGEIWGYHSDGLFRTDEEAANYPVDQTYVNQAIISAAGDSRGLHAGDVRFLDLNGDGYVDAGKNTVDDPGDRTIIGNKSPRYNYGINLSLNYFGFDFEIFFQGVGKMDWAPSSDNVLFWGPYARPYATLMPKNFHKMIWSEDNPDSYLPRPRGYVALGSNRELTVPSDRYLQDISYCRLKNLTVGYTLPEKLTDRIGAGPIRFYFSGENLHYWSPFKEHSRYIDPEMAQTNSTNKIYPWQKSFMFGIDITF